MTYQQLVRTDNPVLHAPYTGGTFGDLYVADGWSSALATSGGSHSATEGRYADFGSGYDYNFQRVPGNPYVNLLQTKTFTIEQWFKGNATGFSSQYLWYLDNAFRFMLYNGQPYLVPGSGQTTISATSSPDLRDNVWHHAVTVANGSTIKTYIDSVEVLSSGIGTFSSPTYLYLFGSGTTSQRLVGYQDELAIYDYALTPAQINSHYTNTAVAPPQPFRGWGMPL